MQGLIMIGDFDATSIVAFIVGAIFTAMLTYFFSYTREKRFLKLRIQIETSEELLKIINIHQGKNAVSMWSYNGAYFNLHNDFIKIRDDNTDKSFNDLIIKNNTEAINNEFDKFRKDYVAYYESVFQVTRYIQSRQIILENFKNFHNAILEKMSGLCKLINETSKIQMNIINLVYAKKVIEEAFIIKLKEKSDSILDLMLDICFC